MTARTLDERLDAAKRSLDAAETLLAGNAGLSVGSQLRRSLATASSIAHWREMLLARNAARTLLSGLEDRIEADEHVAVQFGVPRRADAPMRIKFSHARLIAIEAYLSLNWSLADRVSAFVGRVLCSAEGGAFNEQQAPKLVSHFVNEKDSLGRSTAGYLFDSIRQTFGWPIGVSYALRNHFIHDGGQRHDGDIFAGNSAVDSFKMTKGGWKRVRDKAISYEVMPTNMRKTTNFPDSPEDDLRTVMDVCEREMDEALGVLVGSACAALGTHLTFLSGADS